MKSVKKVSSWVRGKKRSHVISIGIFMGVFALIGIAFLFRSFAAGETLYISPATSTVQTGQDVTVSIRMNGGSGVNVIDATIQYNQAHLQYKSIDTSASAFPVAGPQSGGNGTVNIVRGITGSLITGDVEVAKVTFTALSNTSVSSVLQVSGTAADDDLDNAEIVLATTNGTVNITAPTQPSRSAEFSIESSNPTPIVGTGFNLRVYATANNATMQAGEVTVTLPAGLSYTGTLNTTGSAFSTVSTVTGTTAQIVNLVFVTQTTTLTGKQLIATIPVSPTTTGTKSITMSAARLVDWNNTNITPVTANAFTLSVGASSLPAPTVSRQGGAALTTSGNNDTTDLRQAFTITNFDSAATYTVTLAGQNLSLTSNSFSIPATQRNGDLNLQVSATRNGASGSSSFAIRLRSPNINRDACTNLDDLILVNQGYGGSSAELNLDFTGTVGVTDLMAVISGWGSACV